MFASWTRRQSFDRAQTEGERDGFLKLITHSGGKLVGAKVVSRAAGETINELALAIDRGLKASDLVHDPCLPDLRLLSSAARRGGRPGCGHHRHSRPRPSHDSPLELIRDLLDQLKSTGSVIRPPTFRWGRRPPSERPP